MINPELRPNIQNTRVFIQLQGIAMDNKSQKQGQSKPVSKLTSTMKALKSYISLQIVKNYSAEIKLN